MTVEVALARVECFDALGATWRQLEAEAADPAFFQSWTWVGCLAEERFPHPVLLRAEEHGRLVGLALFNRRRGQLCLTESGDPVLDAPFIEHNGPLLAREAGPQVLGALLQAAWRCPGIRRLRLGGVPPEVLRAAGGTALRLQERLAPVVRLDAVRAAGRGYLGGLSANTRYQLRRSARRYAEQGGAALRRAATEAEALDWLDVLIELHGQSWRRRGKPGAFGNPFMRRFHRALVARALARGEVDLLRLDAAGEAAGYLYNFRLHGRIYAYQSGFADSGADPHAKPGLTCHHLAVEQALAAGDREYDFLAGADRYKLSFAKATEPLLWAEMVPTWSGAGLVARLMGAIRRQGAA
jgi:CelD/BcsL family acetyltransferase involved in cellulose biosynthesis